MKTLLLAALPAAAMISAAIAAPPNYKVAETIPGPDGGWDYARVDPETRRLYVARTDSVTVVDLEKQAVVASFGHLARGHAAVPVSGNRLMVTSGNDATLRFFATGDGHEIVSLPIGKKADAAIYDAATERAFIMNSDDGTISVVDVAGMTVLKTIKVKPALEYGALTKDGTLFVNDEDANELEVIDVVNGKFLESIAMPGCEGPTGLGYDSAHDRLISACANGKAMVIDAGRRRVTGHVDIGKGADAVIVDVGRKLIFIPAGQDGMLDILSIADGNVTHVGNVPTERGARTGALDPATGAIYLPTAKVGPPAKAGGKPVPVAGSFHILVVRPS